MSTRAKTEEIKGKKTVGVRTSMTNDEHRQMRQNLASRLNGIDKELVKYSEMYYLKNKIDYKFFSEKRDELLAEKGAISEYLGVLLKHKDFLIGRVMPTKELVTKFAVDLKRLENLGLIPGETVGISIRQST